MIQPSVFIPAAEETGLIEPLGLWVLRESCRVAARWPRLPSGASVGISVNVSARQLQEAGFVDDVRRALADSGLGADALTLEITESVIAQQRESLSSTLESLRALGVRLALDDFGTGYSSLSQLRSLPVAELKIDRSFVRGLHTDADNAALVRAKLDLGRALGLTTVAEGVESDAEAEELRLLGCDLGQGFHFARPLPADAFERHLARSGTQRPAA